MVSHSFGYINIEPELFETIYYKGQRTEYAVSSFGRIKSFKEQGSMILRQATDARGYKRTCLTIDGRRKKTTIKVHREVAIAFVDNPNSYKEVNHKNGIKDDNSVNNLEWMTCKMNVRHAFANGIKKNPSGGDDPRATMVGKFLGDELIKEYSYMGGVKIDGHNQRSVSRAIRTGIKHHGFTWKFLD